MTEKGWFIRTAEPNNLFWSLREPNNMTDDVGKALLFARKQDAEDYFEAVFHNTVHAQFRIEGVN